METTFIDNNPTLPAERPADSVEALAARLKSAEANPAAAKGHQTVGGTVTSEAQSQPGATPPADNQTPPPEANKDGLRQFKDKEGNVDLSKVTKANEHLERGIKEREELLKRNKELLSKFTKTSQELAKTNKEIGGQGAQASMPEGGHGQNMDDAFLARLEKAERDPFALRDIIREEARALLIQENGEIRSVLNGMRQENEFATRAAELDQLVQSGHTWIVTEGLGRFDKVFEERPQLLQGRTPYLDALKFMDTPNGTAPARAQGGSSTPILGAGSAVPPPSSAPTATKEQKMGDLSAKLHEAFKYGEKDKAAQIMAEMNRLELGR